MLGSLIYTLPLCIRWHALSNQLGGWASKDCRNSLICRSSLHVPRLFMHTYVSKNVRLLLPMQMKESSGT